METIDSEKRLLEIFNDLKKDRMKNGKTINLIHKERKLVADKNTQNFQADHTQKLIKYNPDFFHNHFLKSNDNVIRYVLLHEEVHLSKGKNYSFLLFIPSIVIVLISALIMYSPISAQLTFQEYTLIFSNIVMGIVFLTLMLLIIISSSWRILWDSMYNEEINSDLYGAECLVDFFHENNPANIAGEFLLMKYTEKEEQRIKRLKIIMKIIGVYPDYHPTECERIEKIREKFPSK